MTIQSLGHAVHIVSIVAAAYDPGEDGNPRIYAVTCGKTATLHVIDVYGARSERSYELEGSTHCWGVVRQTDGTIYMSSAQGYLYRLRPGAEQAENLGQAVPGESFLWQIAEGEDGNIYGGTYPGGKLFRYEPANATFRDYGQMVPGEQYARCLAVDGGTVYVGIGTVKGHLAAVDAATGEKRLIPLPPGAEDEQLVYDVTVRGSFLFARMSVKGTLHVRDLRTESWIDRVDNCLGWDVSLPHPESGEVYFIKDGLLHAYDAQARRLSATGLACEQAMRDSVWIRWRDQMTYPGWSLISVVGDGGCWLYNPATGAGAAFDTDVPGQPNKIQSLAVDAADRVYAGGFFHGGVSVYDPHTERITEFGTVGQPEGLLAVDDRLYMGIYTHAVIYRFDPMLPWEKGVNPQRLFSLYEHGQDRPFALVPAGGSRIAIGTVPFYGQHGGTLTIYDAKADRYDVHRHVVRDQSVVCLAHADGFVYGGTSIHGGLGTTPLADEGKLFVWDVARGEKQWEGVPIPGEPAVFALAVDRDGAVWGATASALFRFDPRTRQVDRRESLEAIVAPEMRTGWHGWHGGYLACRPDGSLVGDVRGTLFRYEPAAGALTVLAEGVGRSVCDSGGRLYFTRDTELFVLSSGTASV
ncbi:PQQ-binding-like beta-propeller repeat protein [Paenibacillus cymbidii]|uniref:PQQ-binding-like beta-propeller repeat protein n=1 Tax=Paenibacillus cymbidii TaxID=1639034 RepID=UPI0014369886|nr:PQQ-binding-like beta-propeller repeat protein [Paenibacillus cymbidii]